MSLIWSSWLHVGVGDADIELGRLLTQDLEHHQVFGQILLEGLVLLGCASLSGARPAAS